MGVGLREDEAAQRGWEGRGAGESASECPPLLARPSAGRPVGAQGPRSPGGVPSHAVGNGVLSSSREMLLEAASSPRSPTSRLAVGKTS